ncbi:hypothetical protein LOZ58_003689 [Ophidiomyces ophidiicola]|nr:hypothetical protein LOZ65_003340 [Ophidiomyces ophidiicola]KAI1942091.1 hypothetical protein LOZ66_001573 [Ophidiomyces ophidiicola]KAI1960617.1 hypothetical protein LOZ58_003689 [Ophidiomyces ophidiicola]
MGQPPRTPSPQLIPVLTSPPRHQSGGALKLRKNNPRKYAAWNVFKVIKRVPEGSKKSTSKDSSFYKRGKSTKVKSNPVKIQKQAPQLAQQIVATSTKVKGDSSRSSFQNHQAVTKDPDPELEHDTMK